MKALPNQKAFHKQSTSPWPRSGQSNPFPRKDFHNPIVSFIIQGEEGEDVLVGLSLVNIYFHINLPVFCPGCFFPFFPMHSLNIELMFSFVQGWCVFHYFTLSLSLSVSLFYLFSIHPPFSFSTVFCQHANRMRRELQFEFHLKVLSPLLQEHRSASAFSNKQ